MTDRMSDVAATDESRELAHRTDGETLFEVRDLQKHFPLTKGLLVRKQVGAVRAVDGVSFDVKRGETLGLVGESGCGKSTTGRLMLRLLDPTAGSIKFEGQEIADIKPKELVEFRRDAQMIFQDPYSSLNPRKTVGSIIGEPFAIHKLKTGEGERRKAVQDLMDTVGLNPEHFNRYPHEFSGGQRQRIGVARAIALRPKLIVADEPVSALDVSIQAQVLNLLRELQRDLGLTLDLHRPRPLGRPPHVRPRRRHVPRPDRRAGELRPALRPSADALHRRADVGGADRGPEAGRGQEAPDPRRRRAVTDQPAARLPLPHPLLEGAGHLPPGRSAAGGEGRRQPRRLPLPAHGRRGGGAGADLPRRLSAVDRFQAAVRARGVEVAARVLPDSARTAPEAAAAVGVEVGAIVKSLVFRCGDEAVLALVSGANRADEARLEEEFGAPVGRADADFARAATGFSIGGVPPLGHPAPLRTIVDEDLLGYEVVWAAAGTPHAVFPIEPAELARLVGGRVVRLAAPAR